MVYYISESVLSLIKAAYSTLFRDFSQVPDRCDHVVRSPCSRTPRLPCNRQVSNISKRSSSRYSISRIRVIESTLRTTNNLLERLHASFFFYIMTGPEVFLKIGSFLPSAVIVSVGMMFAGLYEWVKASWIPDDAPTGTSEKKANTKQKWIRRRKPVLQALGIVISTHVAGLLLFSVITSSFFNENQQVGFCFLPCLRALQLTALS